VSISISDSAPSIAADIVVAERIKTIEKAGGTLKRIAEELCSVAFSRIDDYLTVAEGGEICANTFEEIKAQKGGKRKLAAIKKVKEHTRITESKDGEQMFKTSTVEFELYDKLDALWRLVELRGDEPAKNVQVTGKGGEPIQHELTCGPEVRAIVEDLTKLILGRPGESDQGVGA
jgi:hypothetical protein